MATETLNDKVEDLRPAWDVIVAVFESTVGFVGWLAQEAWTWNGIVLVVLLVLALGVVRKYAPLVKYSVRIGQQTETKFVEKVADQRATGMVSSANAAAAIIRQVVLLTVFCGAIIAYLAAR